MSLWTALSEDLSVSAQETALSVTSVRKRHEKPSVKRKKKAEAARKRMYKA